MGNGSHDIFPVFQRLMQRSEKEALLKQRAKTIWLTGLPAAGKTSIAIEMERMMHREGYFVKVLDGDNVRVGLNSDLGFTDAERKENIRRIAEVSKLFVDGGIITINCFLSPTEEISNIARSILRDDLIEVYVNTPLYICEQRDVKGLYAKARRGELKNFTGIDAPFEAPAAPAFSVSTESISASQAASDVYRCLEKRIRL
jgi:adenylylsulfate kinase